MKMNLKMKIGVVASAVVLGLSLVSFAQAKKVSKVPAGAMALCRDYTYSFSQNHRGTCSHHGGVRIWYR